MEAFLLRHEPLVRLGVFVGVLGIIALWELRAPRRVLQASKRVRWANNLALAAMNSVLVRVLLPIAAIGVADFAVQHEMGLLNIFHVPHALGFPLALLALDVTVYLQHLMFHAVPLLWRVHRMHHADLDFDVTTGARFHPVEIVLSMLIKITAILVLGPPALAVLLFEVLLNATSMFSHGNVRLPAAADRLLRWIVVTPEMHRVHHSIISRETNSNFGFNLPWWDHVFGTYRAQPLSGHEHMSLGIAQFRTPRELWLDRMLLQPFRNPGEGYALGRRDEPAR